MGPPGLDKKNNAPLTRGVVVIRWMLRDSGVLDFEKGKDTSKIGKDLRSQPKREGFTFSDLHEVRTTLAVNPDSARSSTRVVVGLSPTLGQRGQPLLDLGLHLHEPLHRLDLSGALGGLGDGEGVDGVSD